MSSATGSATVTREASWNRASPGACWRARLSVAARSTSAPVGAVPTTARCRPGVVSIRNRAVVPCTSTVRPTRAIGRRPPGRNPAKVGSSSTRAASYPLKTAGAREPGGRACHSSWRNAARSAGGGVRVGEAQHGVGADRAGGGVDHGGADRQGRGGVVELVEHPAAAGQRHPQRELPEDRLGPPVEGLDAGHALAGQHQVDAVRAALAGQLLQQVDGLAGQRVVAGEQHVELVDDRHDAGQRAVPGRSASLVTPCRFSAPARRCASRRSSRSTARPYSRSDSMPTARACGSQDGSRPVGTNSVKLTPSLKSSR